MKRVAHCAVTYRILLIFLFLLAAITTDLCSQSSTLKVYTRFSGLGQYNYIVPDRRIVTESAFQFYGGSLALRRHKPEHRFHEFELGGYYSGNRYPEQEYDRELFIRFQTHLFRPVIDRSWWRAYFSLGPRLFYGVEKTTPLASPSGYPADYERYGLEVPIIFSLDLHLTKRLLFSLQTNMLSYAYFSDISISDNPALTERQRKVGGTGTSLYFFNEFRIGMGYKLGE
jgi:hypothetical protein